VYSNCHNVILQPPNFPRNDLHLDQHMKFLVKEHTAFKTAIEEKGLRIDDFSFVKKRGKLHVNYKKESNPFVFYRKKETQLNDNLQWSEQISYFIFLPQKAGPLNNWDEVVKAFQGWLKSL